jgi:hypothetical protein
MLFPYGITATFTPVRNWYAAYGVYDGNLARGRQTGIHGTPDFNGYYFQIAEAGTAWLLGRQALPGSIGRAIGPGRIEGTISCELPPIGGARGRIPDLC